MLHTNRTMLNNSLPQETAGGIIFHAWNWSLRVIQEHLEDIAAAGFKSIQISPMQGNKEDTLEGDKWWILYQPINFKIGNVQIGNRDELIELCRAAEKYSIHIIVDVIVNHTANCGGGDLAYLPDDKVDLEIRGNKDFFNEARGVEDWGNRWQVTKWGIGLPDLNTGNEALQELIIYFLQDLIACGVKGFRFDAAKHIEMPDDPEGNNFWPRVLGALSYETVYSYGEVLQGGADRFYDYARFLNLTASNYGHHIRSAVGLDATIDVAKAVDYDANQVSPSQLITWVESHDTFANDHNESTGLTEWQIKMGWAIIVSRAKATPLFFNRPIPGTNKFAHQLGTVGNLQWQDKDIVALNHFHNRMIQENENLVCISDTCLMIERGNKGSVIVNLGEANVIKASTHLPTGAYINQLNEDEHFRVEDGKLYGELNKASITILYHNEQ